jgi:hypothetical protein
LRKSIFSSKPAGILKLASPIVTSPEFKLNIPIAKIKIATAINPPITSLLFPKISLSDDLIVEIYYF